jgi:hypothetical protein
VVGEASGPRQHAPNPIGPFIRSYDWRPSDAMGHPSIENRAVTVCSSDWPMPADKMRDGNLPVIAPILDAPSSALASRSIFRKPRQLPGGV